MEVMLQGCGRTVGRGVAFPAAERRLHIEDEDVHSLVALVLEVWVPLL